MVKRWDELEGPFRKLVFRDGVEKVADRIPVHRSTVYRMLKGEIKRPCQAIRQGVERALEEPEKLRSDG